MEQKKKRKNRNKAPNMYLLDSEAAKSIVKI